ncbi:hypothetical protein BJV74DRAFT_796103 [Russula compacta]|nr:hypothetical protein BJV74DRAFT_796103 [Russula compacta]
MFDPEPSLSPAPCPEGKAVGRRGEVENLPFARGSLALRGFLGTSLICAAGLFFILPAWGKSKEIIDGTLMGVSVRHNPGALCIRRYKTTREKHADFLDKLLSANPETSVFTDVTRYRARMEKADHTYGNIIPQQGRKATTTTTPSPPLVPKQLFTRNLALHTTVTPKTPKPP